jgi:hydroxymethylpyrimidine/phosphomethylpyrimidine kinase
MHGFGPTKVMTCIDHTYSFHSYILDIGASEDWLALQIAMFPCLIGYHHIAQRLSTLQDPSEPKNANRYRQWIDNYIADDYTQAVGKGMGKCFFFFPLSWCLYSNKEVHGVFTNVEMKALVEGHIFKQSPCRIEELVKIFIHATKVSGVLC